MENEKIKTSRASSTRVKEEKKTILEYFRTGNYQEALNKGKQLLKKDLNAPSSSVLL